jgi:NAD(P)-dependent dehydrogenase (short-subunit alcohol dehydrogenase family)
VTSSSVARALKRLKASFAISGIAIDVQRDVGRLDALINNAGITNMKPIALTPVEVARRIIETTFLDTFLMSQAAIRLLHKSDAPRWVSQSWIPVMSGERGLSDACRK